MSTPNTESNSSEGYRPDDTFSVCGLDQSDDLAITGNGKENDPESARAQEERLAVYRANQAAKPNPIAKSVVIMDVKPWDSDTDLKALENAVRSIEKDGLVWGVSKLIPIGFGLMKLHISLVVEDDKVSTIDLQEEIEGFEDHVQSSDVPSLSRRQSVS